MNLLLLLPFCAVLARCPVDGDPGEALAGLLLLGSVQALAKLVPLPPLDGYTMLGHVAGGHRVRARAPDGT